MRKLRWCPLAITALPASLQVVLGEAGEARPGPRRPFEYAVLQKGPAFASAQIDAQVRLDTPVSESNRDVIVVSRPPPTRAPSRSAAASRRAAPRPTPATAGWTT